MEFALKTEHIQLIQLLKATQMVESGGVAKLVVDEGMVAVNGELEHRKRRKLQVGDVVEFEGQRCTITQG